MHVNYKETHSAFNIHIVMKNIFLTDSNIYM